jgi:hypothetical protein
MPEVSNMLVRFSCWSIVCGLWSLVCFSGCATPKVETAPAIVCPEPDLEQAAKPAVSRHIYQGPIIQQDLSFPTRDSDWPVKSEFDSVLMIVGVIFLGLLGILAAQNKERGRNGRIKHKFKR